MELATERKSSLSLLPKKWSQVLDLWQKRTGAAQGGGRLLTSVPAVGNRHMLQSQRRALYQYRW